MPLVGLVLSPYICIRKLNKYKQLKLRNHVHKKRKSNPKISSPLRYHCCMFTINL